MITYKINFDAGGSTENADLEVIQQIRLLQPGVITAIHKRFYVVGDPELQYTEEYSDSEARLFQLQGEFMVSQVDELLDPQPAGLND